MREADSFAGLILDAGATEELEDALTVIRRNAAAVVLYFVLDAKREFATADNDAAGARRIEILDRIVDAGCRRSARSPGDRS